MSHRSNVIKALQKFRTLDESQNCLLYGPEYLSFNFSTAFFRNLITEAFIPFNSTARDDLVLDCNDRIQCSSNLHCYLPFSTI